MGVSDRQAPHTLACCQLAPPPPDPMLTPLISRRVPPFSPLLSPILSSHPSSSHLSSSHPSTSHPSTSHPSSSHPSSHIPSMHRSRSPSPSPGSSSCSPCPGSPSPSCQSQACVTSDEEGAPRVAALLAALPAVALIACSPCHECTTTTASTACVSPHFKKARDKMLPPSLLPSLPPSLSSSLTPSLTPFHHATQAASRTGSSTSCCCSWPGPLPTLTTPSTTTLTAALPIASTASCGRCSVDDPGGAADLMAAAAGREQQTAGPPLIFPQPCLSQQAGIGHWAGAGSGGSGDAAPTHPGSHCCSIQEVGQGQGQGQPVEGTAMGTCIGHPGPTSDPCCHTSIPGGRSCEESVDYGWAGPGSSAAREPLLPSHHTPATRPTEPSTGGNLQQGTGTGLGQGPHGDVAAELLAAHPMPGVSCARGVGGESPCKPPCHACMEVVASSHRVTHFMRQRTEARLRWVEEHAGCH
ncbi:hypothetical protein V8C86DRAFT_2574577 [Haematococcus lacustris]